MYLELPGPSATGDGEIHTGSMASTFYCHASTNSNLLFFKPCTLQSIHSYKLPMLALLVPVPSHVVDANNVNVVDDVEFLPFTEAVRRRAYAADNAYRVCPGDASLLLFPSKMLSSK